MQEYWSGLRIPSPGDLPDPGIEPGSPTLQTDSLPSESPGKPVILYICIQIIDETGPTQLLLLLLLLLRRCSRVQLCATPSTAAHQALLSLGFSRQEHWSGLPFPSPMHESENESEVAQLCPTLRDPMDCSPPGSSIPGIFQARGLEWGAIVCGIDAKSSIFPK